MALGSLVVDLDGTVWDSAPLYAEIIAAAAGGTASDHVQYLRKGGNVVRLVDRISVLSRMQFSELLSERGAELRIFDTVRETLDRLASKGVSVGAATSLAGWICEPLLEASGLGPAFGALTHPSHARKPSADVVTRTLRILGCNSEDALFVGDTASDARCATNAGIRFAWASWGYGAEEPPGTTVRLERFSEILRL